MALPLLPIAVGLQAAGSVAGGIAGVRSANALLTDEEERRLRRLRALQQGGDLGLTRQQEAVTRSAALQGYRSDVAEQQAQMNQALQSAGGGSPRDIFLARRMQQEGNLDARAKAQAEVFAADQAKKEAQRNEIARLEADETARRQGRAQAVAAAFGGVTAAAGQAVAAKYQEQAAKKAQADQATMLLKEQKALDDARRKRAAEDAFINSYSSIFLS